MTKQTSIVLCALFMLIIGAVFTLEYAGRDSEDMIQFLGAIIVPTIAALWAGDKAAKAERTAARAEHNTNGRMKELIEKVGGVDDPELYDDVLDDDGGVTLDDENDDERPAKG